MSYNNETGMYEGYIYMIKNNLTGGIYIGQTRTTIYQRMLRHYYDGKPASINKSKSDIDIALYEYGKDNFTVEIIEELHSDSIEDLEALLNQREVYWISFYDSFKNPLHYNMTPGGNNLHVTTEIPVLCYNCLGELVGEYKSLHDAEDKLGVSASIICLSCKNPYKYRRGGNYIFRYVDNPFTDEDIENVKIKFPQYFQYDFDGNLLRVFNSRIEALDYLGIRNNSIEKSIFQEATLRNNRSYKGYIWRRYPETFESRGLPNRINRPVEKRNPYTGDLIKTYDNINSVVNEEGFSYGVIRSCCTRTNGRMISHGYHWCYEGDYDEEAFSNFKLNNRNAAKYIISDDRDSIYSVPTNVYTKDNIYVNTFINRDAIISALNIEMGNLLKCLNGEIKPKGGYRLFRANDPSQPDLTKVTNITTKELYYQQIENNNTTEQDNQSPALS